MRSFKRFFQTLSAFILGIGIACSVSSAVADITYQVATGIISGASSIVRINGTTDYLTFASPSNSYFNIIFGDGGTTATQKMNIAASTLSGDNDSSLYLCAGGLNGGTDCSSAFGAAILMDGENTAGKGDIQISTGDAAGSDMYLDMAATNSSVIFRDAGTNHQLWTYSVNGNITQNTTYGGSLIMAKAATSIIQGAASIDSDVTGVSVANPNVGIFADQSTNGGIVNISNGTNGAGAAYYAFQTRSTTGSDANTIVQNGDVISHWRAYAADGASYRLAAQIRALVDGAPGSSDMPGALEFLTTADGGTTHAVALKLGNDKKATFSGNVEPAASATYNMGGAALGWTNVYTNNIRSVTGADLNLRGTGTVAVNIYNNGLNTWAFANGGTLTSVTGNGGDLIFANTGTGVQYPITTSISAAGTTQSDATALSNTINHVGTVTAGTGVKLDAATQGKFRVIANFGANTLNLYPASGDALNNNAADAALTIASKKVAWCYALNTTDWIVIIGS